MKDLRREVEMEALKLAAVREEQRRTLEAMETSEDLGNMLTLLKCRDWFLTNLRAMQVIKYGYGTLSTELSQFEESCVQHIQDIDRELCTYRDKYMNKVQQKVIENILRGLNLGR